MKNFYFILITLVFITGCSKTDEEKISDLYTTGLTQIQQFQYLKADSTFSKIFEINETAFEGLLGQALVKEARLLFYDAIYDYDIILQRSTDFEEAFQGTYRCYQSLGDFEKAFETAISYQKRWKDNPAATYLLGEASYNLGQYPRAVNYFKQAIEEGYTFPEACQYGMAAAYVKEGSFDSAQTVISGLSVNDNSPAELLFSATRYYEARGEIDSAISLSKKYYEADLTSNTNRFQHFQLCLSYDYLYDARQVITYLHEQQADSQVAIGFKLYYALDTDAKDLIRKYGAQFRTLTPGMVSGIMFEMNSRGALSDYLSLTQDMTKLDNNIIKGLYGQEFGQFLQYKLYMLYTSFERSPPSLPLLDKLPGMWRNRLDFKLRVALIKHLIGYFEESYADLKNLKAGHATQPEWLTGIAEIWGHVGLRKYDLASEIFNEALQLNPYYLPAFQKHIEMLTRLKKYDKILALYKKYPQFEKNSYTNYLKTEYYFLTGQFDKGIKHFQGTYTAASGNIVYLERLYQLLHQNNRTEEIKQLMSVLEEKQKDNPDAITLLAKIEHNNGNYSNALRLADKAISIEPDASEGYVQRARALYYTGKKTEAYDLFEKNLIRFVDHPVNLLYYSRILSDESIDFPKAANLARQATFNGYGAYEYVINLADIYYKMGRFDLSGGEANKAIFIAQENPYPYFRHGMALYRNGIADKKKEAKKQLNKAIELGLSGEYKTEALSTLKKL